MADRTGTMFGSEELAPTQSQPLSYRACLLINLAVSVSLYGLGYMAFREGAHLVAHLFGQ